MQNVKTTYFKSICCQALFPSWEFQAEIAHTAVSFVDIPMEQQQQMCTFFKRKNYNYFLRFHFNSHHTLDWLNFRPESINFLYLCIIIYTHWESIFFLQLVIIAINNENNNAISSNLHCVLEFVSEPKISMQKINRIQFLFESFVFFRVCHFFRKTV